ncbi:MAG: hypothetical protein FWG81_00880 [Betaproteobacteria bacterium]|nr:hypothetical protein [Betaproteobacteria bacterium]
MSNSRFLWKKILLLLGGAFLPGFALFSCAIVWSVAQGVKKDSESHVAGVAAINETRLKGMLSASYATVVDAATSFESLDALPAGKRRYEGDAILAWMLNNTHIHNVWVAYEPNSLDGEDASRSGEYPGAPSGRYMRSYIRSDKGSEEAITLIPGMEEKELNNPDMSGWYKIPLESGKVFNGLDFIFLSDYKTGGGHAASITVSSPILRHGKAVGVVGGGVLARDLAFDSEFNGQVVTAVFSAEEKLIFSQNIEQIGMAMQDMRLPHLDQIRQAMRARQEIFLQNEYSWLLDADAFIYLKPVLLEGFGGEVVYIYAALPSSVVDQAVFRALRPIAVYLVVVLLAFAALLLFIVYHARNTLNRLAHSIDMISGTGGVQDLPYLERQDEVGDLARSVSRLWQYFRMRLNYLYLVKIKLDSYLAIQNAIHKSLSFEEASKHILQLLRVSCKADTARFFIYLGRQARLFAISGTAGEFHIRSVALAPEFEGHETLAEALEGKHYLLLKRYAMRSLGLEFVAPKAWAVCILPIRAGKQLRAFIILETANSRQVILHDDAVLNFISDRLADFFIHYAPVLDAETELASPQTRVKETVNWATLAKSTLEGSHTASVLKAIPPEAPPPAFADMLQPETDKPTEIQRFMAAARNIPNLGVDKALSMLGGNSSLYMEMLSLSARELAISMGKMREFLVSGDVHAFTIEVHGSKGALNTIGAFYLGEQAYRLEMTARENDIEGCRLSYPQLEEALSDFIESLKAMLPKQETSPRERRHVEDLTAGLKAVRAALEDYNLLLAGERLRHTMRFSYAAPGLDEADMAGKLEMISNLLEMIEYEEAGQAIQELLASTGVQAEAGRTE